MSAKPVIALSGGVGGAKLVLGLSHCVPADRLAVVANTGDDFEHYGLRICPDIDTVLYTLSGLADRERGWGRSDESWQFMHALSELGGEDWFNLGDRDLALHVLRSFQLKGGVSLGDITANLARAMGIDVTILPMSEQPVATMVHTEHGPLTFQHYFVRERCAPVVTGFEFAGVDTALPNPALVTLISEHPEAIILAPSNPYVSIDPILAIPGMHDLLKNSGAPIVAVSPIINGGALKGPAAKMMNELGAAASAVEVARHYQGFIDGLIIDESDRALSAEIAGMGMKVEVAQTIMSTLDDRIALAEISLDLARRISGKAE